MADWDEATESGEVETPAESLPAENDDLEPAEVPEDAESGEQDQDQEADEAEQEPEKSRYTARVKAAVDKRNEVLRAAEEAGLVYDEDAKKFLPKDTGNDAQDDGEGFAWEPATEPEQPAGENALDLSIERYREFWDADTAALEALDAETAAKYPVAVEWFKRAYAKGFDPETMTRNDWASLKEACYITRQTETERQTQRAAYEQQAAKKVNDDLRAMETELAQSEKARAFVKAEVKRFKDEGRSPSEIAAILENIKAKAVYLNLSDFTAQAGERAVREAEGRKVLLGGQGGKAAAGEKPATSLTPAQQRAAKGMRMTDAEYAKFLGED